MAYTHGAVRKGSPCFRSRSPPNGSCCGSRKATTWNPCNRCSPIALQHVGTQAVWSRERVGHWLLRCSAVYAERGYTMYTAIRRETDAIVGLSGLLPNENGDPELGTVIMRRYWRQGHFRETVGAILSRVEKVPNIRRIVARMEVDHFSGTFVERVLFAHGFIAEKEALCPRSGELMRHYQWLPRTH
ncbi:GNAT family N-acetyltransferase [Streptomyces sp. NPDC055709]